MNYTRIPWMTRTTKTYAPDVADGDARDFGCLLRGALIEPQQG